MVLAGEPKMGTEKFYTLPELEYGYDALVPHMSEEQLRIHHQRHHQAYVKGANAILERLAKARETGTDVDMRATLKELSFNIGGHILHSLFWGNLAPAGGGTPGGRLADALTGEFGGFERFRREFTQTALSVEGSGWAALAFCRQTQRPILMQIEKHNTNVHPMFGILMVLDVFEHAYYIDHRNARAKFVDAFWNIVNWDAVNARLENIMK